MWRFGRAGERRPSNRRAPWDRREWRAWKVPGGGVSRRGESDGASRIACGQPPLDQLIEQRRSRLTGAEPLERDRKSTRLNSSHSQISYAVFCLKKKTNEA